MKLGSAACGETARQCRSDVFCHAVVFGAESGLVRATSHSIRKLSTFLLPRLGRTSDEKDIGGSHERSSRDQGLFRGGDDQRDHQRAGHATTAEKPVRVSDQRSEERCRRSRIGWIGAAFVVADATSRSYSTTIANATQSTIAGNVVRSYSPSGQKRQGEQRKRRPPVCDLE